MSPKASRRPPPPLPVTARFFRSRAAFRKWLEKHHDRAAEIWLGFHRKASNRKGLAYPEAVETALCFGWIDGVRKKLDDTTYVNRFTPRKPGSTWSLVNIRHVERLKTAGLMHSAGLAAYDRRDPAKSGIYSFEVRPSAFPAHLEARVRAVAGAWEYFDSQPPGYRRLAIFYVISAKRDETQLRRLQSVIDASAAGVRLGVLFGQTGAKARPATANGPAPAPSPKLSSAERSSKPKARRRSRR